MMLVGKTGYYFCKRLCEICKEYGMEVNVKKTKTMVLNKSVSVQCSVTAYDTKLEQMLQYKYLGPG